MLLNRRALPRTGEWQATCHVIVMFCPQEEPVKNGKKATLLCIDDEPTALKVRQMMLEILGYVVLTARDGHEGLQMFSSQAVDAVLLDYAMPGLDGGQVATSMRQLKPEVPIIMLSAYVDLPEEALRAVDAFVTKGDSTETLLSQIQSCLEQRGR